MSLEDRNNRQSQMTREELEIIAARSRKDYVRFDTRTGSAVYFPYDRVSIPIEGIFPENMIESGYVAEQSVGELRRMCRAACSGEPADSREIICRRGDGEMCCHQVEYTLLPDEDGKATLALFSFQAESGLSEREAAFDAWRQSLLTMFAEDAIYIEFNLSRGALEWQTGLPEGTAGTRPDCTYSEFIEYGCEHLIYEEDCDAYREFFDRDRLLTLFERGVTEDKLEYRDRNDGIKWLCASIQMAHYPNGSDVKLFIVYTDIDNLRSEVERLSKLASRDSMTGVLNHSATEDEVVNILAKVDDDDLSALYMIDIDNFKHINDSFGHQVGDDIICRTASIIEEAFRSTDIVGRMGGDEFLVFISGDIPERAVKANAAHLVSCLQMNIGSYTVTHSVGVALCRGKTTFAAMYAKADDVLYQVKHAGKGSFRVGWVGESSVHEERPTPTHSVSFNDSAVQLRTLSHIIDGGIVIAEVTEGEVLIKYTSPSYFAAFGHSADDVGESGEALLGLVHEDDRDALVEALFAAAETGELLDMVYRVNRDGVIDWHRLRAARLPGSHGSEGERLLGVVTDITEQQHSASQLEALTGSSALGIGLFELSDEGAEASFINSAFETMTGMTLEEINADKNTAALLACGPGAARENLGSGSEQGAFEFSVRVGSLPGGKNAGLYARGVRLYGDAQSSVVLIMCTDVTGEHLLRERLRLADERCSAATSRTDAVFWEVDPETRTMSLTTVNEQGEPLRRTFENAPDDIISEGRIHPDSVGELRRMFADIYAEREGGEYTILSRRHSGSSLWSRSRYTLMRDENGRVFSAFGVSERAPGLADELRRFEGEVRFCRTIEGQLDAAFHVVLDTDRVIYSRLKPGLFAAVTETYGELEHLWRSLSGESPQVERLSARALAELFGSGHGSLYLEYPRIDAAGGRSCCGVTVNMLRHPVTGEIHAFIYERALDDTAPLFRGEEPTRHAVTWIWDAAFTGRMLRRAVDEARGSGERLALTAAEVTGMERFREEHGTAAADRALFTVGRLIGAFADSGVVYGHFDDSRFLLLRRGCGTPEEQRELVRERMTRINDALRKVLPESDALRLVCGFAVEQAEDAEYPALLSRSLAACGTAAQWADAPIVVASGAASEHGDSSAPGGEAARLRGSLRTAERDELTGLCSRSAFVRLVRDYLEAEPDAAYSIVLIDLDRFRIYNDMYGGQAGDRLLRGLGARMLSDDSVRAVWSRMESDHFAALMRTQDIVPDDIFRAAAGWLADTPGSFKLVPCVGIYDIDDPGLSVEQMCDRALLALRSIKGGYQGGCARYSDRLRSSIVDDLQLIGELAKAIADEQFILCFQPQMEYPSGQMIGAEALVRWSHPTRGLLPPASFVPLFERSGCITMLDEYVWSKSCEYIRLWMDKYPQLTPPTLSVNLSRKDIYSPSLCRTLADIIAKYNVPPSLLKLEITESAYIENPEQLAGVVRTLQELGFSVEMDDFGSGYSSLNMLKDIPVDALKLDMRFLSECEDTTRSGSILSSVLRMARWLQLPVIAEGVETREQADYLSKIGCRYMQGFFFSRPLPADRFEQLLVEKPTGVIAPDEGTGMKNVAAFWDSGAQSSLLLGSYIGGVAIVEYRDGEADVLQVNDQLRAELRLSGEHTGHTRLHPETLLGKEGNGIFLSTLKDAVQTKDVAESLLQLPYGEWIRLRARLLAQSRGSSILYLSVDNVTDFVRHEEVLRGRIALADRISEGMPCAMCRFSADDRPVIYEINPAACEAFGYRTSVELLAAFAADPLNLFLVEEAARLRQLIRKLREGGGCESAEFRIRRPSGEARWIKGTIQYVEVPNDKPQLLGLFVDVTEEHRRRRTNELSGHIGAVLASYDEFYEIDKAAGTMTVRFTRLTHQPIGKPIPLDKAVNGFILRYICSEDAKRAQAAYDRGLGLAPSEKATLEYRCVRADGSFIWLMSVMVCVSDSLFMLYSMDITERRQREELERAERSRQTIGAVRAQYYSALEHLGMTVMEWDMADGTLNHCTSSERYALCRTEDGHIRRDIAERGVYPDDLREFTRFLARLDHADAHGETTVRLLTDTGDYRWTRISSDLLRDANGTPERALMTLTDVDEDTLLRYELAQSESRMDSAISQMPGGVALLTLHRDRTEVLVNDVLMHMTGMNGEQLMQRLTDDRFSLVGEADRERVRTAERLLTDCERKHIDGTFALMRADGTSTQVRVLAAVIERGKDSTTVLVVCVDMTLGREDVLAD